MEIHTKTRYVHSRPDESASSCQVGGVAKQKACLSLASRPLPPLEEIGIGGRGLLRQAGEQRRPVDGSNRG